MQAALTLAVSCLLRRNCNFFRWKRFEIFVCLFRKFFSKLLLYTCSLYILHICERGTFWVAINYWIDSSFMGFEWYIVFEQKIFCRFVKTKFYVSTRILREKKIGQFFLTQRKIFGLVVKTAFYVSWGTLWGRKKCFPAGTCSFRIGKSGRKVYILREWFSFRNIFRRKTINLLSKKWWYKGWKVFEPLKWEIREYWGRVRSLSINALSAGFHTFMIYPGRLALLMYWGLGLVAITYKMI